MGTSCKKNNDSNTTADDLIYKSKLEQLIKLTPASSSKRANALSADSLGNSSTPFSFNFKTYKEAYEFFNGLFSGVHIKTDTIRTSSLTPGSASVSKQSIMDNSSDVPVVATSPMNFSYSANPIITIAWGGPAMSDLDTMWLLHRE